MCDSDRDDAQQKHGRDGSELDPDEIDQPGKQRPNQIVAGRVHAEERALGTLPHTAVNAVWELKRILIGIEDTNTFITLIPDTDAAPPNQPRKVDRREHDRGSGDAVEGPQTRHVAHTLPTLEGAPFPRPAPHGGYASLVPSDIAAVVNLHREGQSAVPSLISAWRSVDAARRHGLDAGLVFVLDVADRATIELADEWADRGVLILESTAGDLGDARNRAATGLDAQWLAFLDADDLWGEDWLVRAHTTASAFEATTAGADEPINVWHPQLNVIFGDHHSLLHHIDSAGPEFDRERFRLHNQWTALSFVRRDVLLDIPYPRNDLDAGFGFEDWSWNEEILRRGGRHHVVPDTCHFIRRTTSGSLLGHSQSALRTRYPHTKESATSYWAERVHQSPGVVTEQEADGTHRSAPVSLSPLLVAQLRLAGTIEPAVLETLSPDRLPATLPQNFNTHRTAAHQALVELEHLAANESFSTLSELCKASSQLGALDDASRALVISEVLLDPRHTKYPRGESLHLDHAYSVYPQLKP